MTIGSHPINVIYEDNHLLVVEKPVNIPVQQDESGDPDMLTLLKAYIKEKYSKPGAVFLGLVHRLDRPVGGVMVFARTSKAAARLSGQIRSGSFKKSYYAVVHGIPEMKEGRLINYLLKNEKTNMVQVVDQGTDGAKEAVLDYKVAGIASGSSLLSIDLHTGRSHQIRVQLSAIGHPLYGDQRYGGKYSKPGQQIALWSHRIILEHPTLNEKMTFTSLPGMYNPWQWFDGILDDVK